MKTAMQELLEWVRTTLPMDLDTQMLIEEKIESLLEKERWQVMNAYDIGWLDCKNSDGKYLNDQYYFETFNTNER
jgi:hypothetical protein